MKGYPITLTNLQRGRCIVVGGGAVAERKVSGLLEAGAPVEVISPDITPQLDAWHVAGQITYHAEPYHRGSLTGARLVIAATNEHAVNAAVADEGQALGALVNVADDPAASDFHTAGVVRRGDITLTVSTSGGSPALAALMRRRLEATFGPEYAELATWLRQIRDTVGPQLQPQSRTALYRALATEEVLDWLRAGDHEQLATYTDHLLSTLERIVP
ncbi:MAG: bifunctional precorrin-2 dehydrogenase/sirohydrochlorin ferrochelatase [Herpetosiphonaceae bacterium]|nr:bifunctional precorrin-2 dehydrogenase/sirohydrochlorin ferrochelatase [Herpetosiphonaceae bacterium]